MQSGATPDRRLLAWNGLQISHPSTWEPRVTGLCHLIFEEDFQPRLQLRWQKNAKADVTNLELLATKLTGSAGFIFQAEALPPEWRALREKFQLLTCSQRATGAMAGGVLYCQECMTLIYFQVFPGRSESSSEVARSLTTLSCHGQQELMWRIDDFSLVTPSSFILSDYTFAAGLTRLSFVSGNLRLQTCKLAPADIRLRQQTLGQILTALAGAKGLHLHPDRTGHSCEGSRTPSLPHRLLHMLRRDRPYIKAHIRHDEEKNRLLTVILSGNHPIPETLLQTLCNHHEIV